MFGWLLRIFTGDVVGHTLKLERVVPERSADCDIARVASVRDRSTSRNGRIVDRVDAKLRGVRVRRY